MDNTRRTLVIYEDGSYGPLYLNTDIKGVYEVMLQPYPLQGKRVFCGRVELTFPTLSTCDCYKGVRQQYSLDEWNAKSYGGGIVSDNW